MFAFKPMSFERWEAANPDLAEQEPDPCPECSGEGEIVCGCCGHAATCEKCNGFGVVGLSLFERYKAQIERDRKAYERAQGLFA